MPSSERNTKWPSSWMSNCRSLKTRAKRELALASVAEAHTGAVCAEQRTDGALRLDVHLHVLSLDGVYVRDTEEWFRWCAAIRAAGT